MIKNKTILWVIICLMMGASQTFGQLTPDVAAIKTKLVDKNATDKTAIIFYNMMENSKKGVMVGQQDAFTNRQINYPDKELTDIKNTSGQNPLVDGLDFMFITDVQNTPGSWFEGQEKIIKEQAILNYSRGVISTFSWHFRNPYTKDWFSVNGDPARVAIANKSIKSLLPGGENHDYYKSVLQKIASVFKELKDGSGTPIPVFFRPFHEFDGEWFWWGKPYCTASDFKAIWIFTVEYLRDTQGVHNVLYAFAPDNRFNSTLEFLERYPGNDYVDMVGMDNYSDFESNNIANAAKKLQIVSDYAKSNTKLAALTECGYRNTTKPDKLYTAYFLKALTQYPLQLSYMMFWSNGTYTPIPGQNTAPDFIDFMANSVTLAEGDVPNMYSLPVPPLKYVSGTVTESNKKRLNITLSAEPKETTGITGFSVKVDGNAVAIDNVEYSMVDKTIAVTLATDITNSQAVTLSYTQGNVESKEGMKLVDFTDQPIENLLTGSAPTLKSAYTDLTGNYIYLKFSKEMVIDGFSSAALTIFESKINNTNIGIKSVSFFNGDLSILAIETTEKLFVEHTLTASYSNNTFSSTDGGILAQFVNTPITNHSPGMAPKLLSGEVLGDGTGIKALFDKQLIANTAIKDNFKVNVNGVDKPITSILYVLNSITLTISEKIVAKDVVTLSFSGAKIVANDRGELDVINGFNIDNKLVKIYKPRYITNVTITASNPQSKVDSAYVGNLAYIDRTFTLSELPALIKGTEYLVWQQGLKNIYASTLLSFKVLSNGTLYIAHDNRLTRPTWLTTNFTNTGTSFALQDTRLTLYSKYYTANQTASLGANQVQGAETGTSSNYIVFFVPEVATSLFENSADEATIQLFPNPCRNEFSIYSEQFAYNTIEIFNMTGKLVYSKEIEFQTKITVPISLQTGLYVVRLNDGKTTKSALISVR